MSSSKEIWQRDLYSNSDIDYIINSPITEYDMKQAGYNLSIYYNLLSKSKLKYLETLTKEQRRIQIGIYMRDDREFNQKLTESFGNMRRMFLTDNLVDDKRILSIRKDAIFIIGGKLDRTVYGNVQFDSKNTYTSFMRLGNTEVFYSSSGIDVKGISDDDLQKHAKTIAVLKRIFYHLETNEKYEFVKFLKKHYTNYLNCNLLYDYYREFNAASKFRLTTTISERNVYIDNMTSEFDELLDISYNYVNIIMPLLNWFWF